MDKVLNTYATSAIEWIVAFAPKLLLAIVVMFVGFRVIKLVHKLIAKAIDRSSIDPEISSMLISLIDIVLKSVVVFTAIALVGVELTALFGVLAAASFAVGMALQGFLGNFASGLTIVFFKPYRVGDWVQISDSFGRVEQIQIFNTILKTPGDKTLVIPNGKVTDDIITNYSTEGKIRLEANVLTAYEEDYPKIKRVICEALANLDIILHDPKPQVGIESYDTHNIIVTVRPYINPDDYWEATFAVNHAIKKAFSENGIKMAYSEGVELGPIGG